MPNWCENDLYIYGPDQDELLERIRTTSTRSNQNPTEVPTVRFIDFETIIPTPECLLVTEASSDADQGLMALGIIPIASWAQPPKGVSLLAHLEATRPRALEEGRKALKAFQETGFYNEIDFHREKCGTKWNATQTRIRRRDELKQVSHLLQFDTPWNPPKPVLQELSKMFSKNRFSLRWFERGMAKKGTILYDKGELMQDISGEYFGKRGG